MLSRRAATRAGRKLNELSDRLTEKTVDGLRVSQWLAEREAKEASEAIRVANEIIYQYYCIPKDVREFWYQGGGDDGISLSALDEA